MQNPLKQISLFRLHERALDFFGSQIRMARTDPARFWHRMLYAAFWISIAFFPIGYGFREVMPPLCLIFLLIWYKYAWRESVLRTLKPVWLFGLAAFMIIVGVVFSTNPMASLIHAGTGVNKAFILPFIAMESVRGLRDLKGLILACVAACFWEGLDGIWQACTGKDFIMGYKLNAGRLTGSLGDYTVGNYLALALVPAAGVWFLLRQKMAWIKCVAICGLLFGPALFLFLGASSRSGMLAIVGSIILWGVMAYGRRCWKTFAFAALAICAFAILQPQRFTPESITNDGRWDLWRFGIAVFKEHPLLGAGAGQYNAVFRELGLVPYHDAITISHPHNLYLDMLYAHGLVGFAAGITFLFGFLIWGWNRIRPELLAEIKSAGIYWHLAACFWLGYAAWLLNGIFGHDFYRIWWLAQAMTSMGIMIGAVEYGLLKEKIPVFEDGKPLKSSPTCAAKQ